MSVVYLTLNRINIFGECHLEYLLDVVKTYVDIANVGHRQSVKRLSSCRMISWSDQRRLRSNVTWTEPFKK